MLHRLLQPLTEPAYVLLRILAGIMLSFHGLQKLFGILTENPPLEPFTQLWIGGVIEVVAGTAVALGLFTTWAAFLASGMMFVAYLQFHWRLQFNAQFFPIINKGELALLNCVVFFFIACRGGGRWNLDRRIFRRADVPKAERPN